MNIGKSITATLLGILLCTLPAAAQMGGAPASSTLTQPRASPHDAVNVRVGTGRGGTLVTIYYGRPYMKGRVVWGTLVPWDAVWRLGSDEGTTLITPKDLVFGDFCMLSAGAYTLRKWSPSKMARPSSSSTKPLATGESPTPISRTKELKTRRSQKDADLDKSVERIDPSPGKRQRHGHPENPVG